MIGNVVVIWLGVPNASGHTGSADDEGGVLMERGIVIAKRGDKVRTTENQAREWVSQGKARFPRN